MAVIGTALGAAALSAYSSRQNAKSQNEAIRASNQPQPFFEERTPFKSEQINPLLNRALNSQMDLFKNRFNPARPQQRGGGGGGNRQPRIDPRADTRGFIMDVANQAQGAAPPGLLDAGSQFVQNRLGDDGFGNNRILRGLESRLAPANLNRGNDLIERFLQGDFGPPQQEEDPADPFGGFGSRGGGRFSGNINISGGEIPTDPRFEEAIDRFLNPDRLDPANDPTLQPLIDSLTREAQENHFRSLADLDAQIEGAGRGGSGFARATRSLANEEFDEALQGTLAQLFAGNRRDAQTQALQAMGLLNSRQIASAQNASSRGAAAAGASAQLRSAQIQAELERERLALERELGFRGQNLGAIQQLIGNNQFGLGALGSLGGQLSNEQFTALGAIPGLSQTGFLPIDAGLQAGGLLTNLDQIAAQENVGLRQAGASRAGVNLQREIFERQQAQEQINNLLKTAGFVGGLGGRVEGQSAPGQYTPEVSTGNAALMGGLGGLSTAAGIAGLFGGGGGQAANIYGGATPYGNPGMFGFA